ncbi:hypothetical protein H5407_05515 [Mitsuaria sp. WAJ17]|uniref:hypothetical protein n=1 Tax=Mitsuaria sp. WAJ17 TaxID=2761452 RepID=UPI0016013504|nr:hypothetical protein [Mitsuaria sp. WAJ17]MBB2484680.1 hypothetical protein [Mitsuaria sp. WAJ17]
MLRILLVATLLLNLLVFIFTQGWLDGLTGLHARGDSDPARLQQQVNPDQMQLLNAQAAKSVQARACLEYGPLIGDEALRSAQAQLDKAGIAAAQWQDLRAEQAGVWAVATIRLPNKDFQQRKEETYKRMRINFEYLAGPPEEVPTMVLSRHGSEKAAEAALEAMSQRALKGLRVMQLQAASSLHVLRFAQADGVTQGKLRGIKELGEGRSCAAGNAASDAEAASAAPSSNR